MPATIPMTVTPEEQATLLARAFEELADIVSESVPPLSAESLRREHMYSREDGATRKTRYSCA